MHWPIAPALGMILLLCSCDRLLPFGAGAGREAGGAPGDRGSAEAQSGSDGRTGERGSPPKLDAPPRPKEGGVPCAPGAVLDASALAVPAQLATALAVFQKTCSPGRSFTAISLHAISACPPQPTIDEVQAAVAANQRSYVSVGAAMSLADLQKTPLFGYYCPSAAGTQLLGAIDAQLNETNPLIWYGDALVPPSCPGCTNYHVRLLLYYVKARRVVVLDGEHYYDS